MFSDELMSFMKNQGDDATVANVTTNVRNLIESLKELKKNFSEILSQLFVENDIEGIREIIDYGNEIDDFINELSVLDFGKPICVKEDADIYEGKDKVPPKNDIVLEKAEKSCILCGKPVWKESDYCKEHFVYDNENKMQAGGMTE